MVRLLTVLALVAAMASPASARAQGFDPSLRQVAAKAGNDFPAIELVTMGIGSLMWERHGHIALCVVYADPRQDVCYNYGIADFQHPLAMAAGFFRGTHSFWAGEMDPTMMLDIYRYADRTIWAQVLPLDAAQKQKVIAKLQSDVLEENRYYAYDHFWDNCTTRVRDILDNATDHALSKMPEIDDDRTYRDLARHGFYGMRIPLLITDIAMGRATDRVPTYWERMFLPDYLREAAQKLWNVTPVAVYTRVGPPPPDDTQSGRVLAALVLLALTAPVWATRLWGRFQRTGLAVALAPQVLLGTVFWFLAIISPLPYVRWNESCLVLIPLDLALLFLGPVRRRLYARGRLAMLGLLALLMIVGVLKQPIWFLLLWPAVPCAVVGFWPAKAQASTAEKATETSKPSVRPSGSNKKKRSR